MQTITTRRFTTGLALGLFLSGTAMAADLAPMPTKAIIAPAPVLNPWTFTVTPYAWVTLLNGSATVKGHTTDVDVGYSELWDVVKKSEIPKDLMVLMGYFEARNGPLGVFNDLVYLNIAVGASGAHSRDLGPVIKGKPLATASLSASINTRFQMVIDQVGAAYEVANWGSGMNRPGSSTAIDLYGGARVWWQQVDLDANLAATLSVLHLLTVSRDLSIGKSGDVTWVDPLVGARLRHQFAPGMNLVVSGDVGGFGAGSKFSWQALAALNYDFYVTKNVTWSGMIGYKALNVDYSQGSGLSHYEYNMTMHGPVMGVTARF
jgi:hypothetical protein